MRDDGIAPRLLAWYDAHARDLPWRVLPQSRAAGARPDPYQVWLSEVMLQQTTVAAVKAYFARFTALWPDVRALAAAEDAAVMAEWAGLGYYARARNLLACARAVVERHDGHFPADPDALRALPGIGPYTAAAIAAIAFDLPATVVDGNVERVVARLFAIAHALPAARPHLVAAARRIAAPDRPGDLAQAMMDLGATICTPRNPACTICPLVDGCQARAQGIAAQLPARAARPPRPTRQGLLWLAHRPDGALLLERRPARGLLGNTLGFPGTGWDGSTHPPPLNLPWTPLGTITHSFTHFHLALQVLSAPAPQGAQPDRGAFLGRNAFNPDDLTTLMRKAHDLAFPEPP